MNARILDTIFTLERAHKMTTNGPEIQQPDPFDLARFVHAQEPDYPTVLAELKAGQKRTHWMWYIFPQIDGLAFSSTAKHYAIKSLQEAQAYLDHPVLGPRLLECFRTTLQVQGKTATQIFGTPDDMKLKSCATLFAALATGDSVFEQLLAKFFGGARDDRTLLLIGR
jgi:uncharacterized protein (DUF1810 family)